MGVLVVVALGSIAWYGWAYGPANLSAGGVLDELQARSNENEQQDAPAGDPWEGSAVTDWPTDIQMPAPKSIDGYSRPEVADALAAAERFLRASMLDPEVLYRGATEPVLRALHDSEDVRDYLGDPRSDRSWTNAATRFKPRMLGAAVDTVHVRGFVEPIIAQGELAVDFSFAVAYAVEPLRYDEPTPVVVVVRREGTLAFIDAVDGDVGLPYPSYLAAVSDRSACGSKWPHPAFTEVLLEPPTSNPTPGPTPTQSADLTDPNDSLRDITECFTNTGTS